MKKSVNNGLKKVGAVIVGAGASVANAATIAAPDMTDALANIEVVFVATLAVSVLIFGFKKIRSVL